MFKRKINLILAGMVLVSFNCLSSSALNVSESTSDQYLRDHGHSDEIIRIVDMQKNKVNGQEIPVTVKHKKTKKFLRGFFWVDPDPTVFLDDFGDRKIEMR